MKFLLLILLTQNIFAANCPQLLLQLTDPIQIKQIELSSTLNNKAYSYWRKYFKGEDAEILALPINRTSYHPKELAQELFGSADIMLKTLQIDPKLTLKKWKIFLASDYIKARWMVRGDGTVISWSLKETDKIYETTSKRIANLLNISIEEAKELGNSKMMPIPGGHQDMLSLLSKKTSTTHEPVVAWGYMTFENGKVTVGTDSYFEQGQDHLFDILTYLQLFLR